MNYYKNCLKLLEERRWRYSPILQAEIYYAMIWGLLDIKNIAQAKNYFEQFNQFHKKNKQHSQLIDQYYKLSEVLILKSSTRIKNKAKAQQLLQEIIEEEIIATTDLKVHAILILCELLLFELKASADEVTAESEVFQEVKTIITDLTSLAQQRHSFSLLVNTLILQARFTLIEGNLTGAMQLLDQAEGTATEKKLEKLSEKVATERQLLAAQLDAWKTLIERNAPLEARLARAQLEDYIAEAIKMVNTDQKRRDS